MLFFNRLTCIVLLTCFSITSYAQSLSEAKTAIRTKDFEQALILLLPLSKQDNVEAQYLLGSLYARGRGTKSNDKEAFRWFYMAAKRGHAQAQFELACLYEQGSGVVQDIDEALVWFQKASDNGL